MKKVFRFSDSISVLAFIFASKFTNLRMYVIKVMDPIQFMKVFPARLSFCEFVFLRVYLLGRSSSFAVVLLLIITR